MLTIKKIEDLQNFRKEALEKRRLKITSGQTQVIIGMGTCGIAVGARDTMDAILETIEKDHLSNILVSQTGCIGKCSDEPIVEVVIAGHPKVTYGKVRPDTARRIIKEHIQSGKPISSHIIPD